jgi:hypothetical protein
VDGTACASLLDMGPRTRRGLLQWGLLAGVPAIISLRPAEARARGSWRSNPIEPRAPSGIDSFGDPSPRPFVFPGGYQWRRQREIVREERDRRRGEFRRFGHDD